MTTGLTNVECQPDRPRSPATQCFTTGFVGGGGTFDGGHVEVPGVDLELDNSSFSVDMWIKLGADFSGVDSLVTYRDAENADNGFGVYVWETPSGVVVPGLLLPAPTLQPFSANPATISIPKDGEWHLIAMTAAADGTIRYYVDDQGPPSGERVSGSDR